MCNHFFVLYYENIVLYWRTNNIMRGEHMISSGVWATMVTPFTTDDKVDYKGVDQILKFYGENQVAGAFGVCQSSEMFYLSLAERKALSAFVCTHLPKGMQAVVSGHVADDLDHQVREAHEIMHPDAKAYVVILNRFAKENESDEILIDRMDHFVRKFDGVPLGIYECPFPYKRLLTKKVIDYCIESGRFLFIKDTCCDIDQMREKINQLSGSSIKLFNANSASLLDSLRAGAAGFSGVMANFHPAYYTWLCEHFKDEPQKAEMMQNYLGFSSLAECQAYPDNAKYYLSLKGCDIQTRSRVRKDNPMLDRQKLEIREFEALSTFMAGAIGI